MDHGWTVSTEIYESFTGILFCWVVYNEIFQFENRQGKQEYSANSQLNASLLNQLICELMKSNDHGRWRADLSLCDAIEWTSLSKGVCTRYYPKSTFYSACRLSWRGHIERKDNADYWRHALSWWWIGKAPVGRPRKTWQNTLSADMFLLKVDSREVQHQNKWRALDG